MRTMFVSREKSVKKKFQKPNILRKNPKTTAKPNMLESFESSDSTALVSGNILKETNVDEAQSDVMLNGHTQFEFDALANTIRINKDFKLMSSETSDCTLHKKNNATMVGKNVQLKKNEENSNQAFVNIDSFLSEATAENVTLYGYDCDPGTSIETLVVIDNESPVANVYVEQNTDEVNNEMSQAEASNTSPVESFYSQLTPIVKYKCDVPNCKKEFRSEQNYIKHQNTHGEDGSVKPPRQVTVECPVKQIGADGTETPCGKIFIVRDELLKHLNEDHTLDDAVYRCVECGRRFFWASGLRAHARAHCRRATGAGAGAGGPQLVCGWAGCGRVFRQPCRLREHARAHTGDRPYPCDYPECGWSFRSASKLVRHARRHTGERRHACAACGRAFLRREHLRDHAARHHRARPALVCAHAGCEQSFSNMSTLYLHMKKVHKKKETSPPATTTSDNETLFSLQKTDNMFLVNVTPESSLTDDMSAENQLCGGLVLHHADVEAEVEAVPEMEADDEREWHSARTHCTWPLEGRAGSCDDNDLLKDDSQVEQLEGSESNTYTVRSDLFLHGNVLINEDSEHMGGVVAAGEESGEGAGGDAGAGSLGADLGLLDAHPTIDLMQEELMYADAAADESSFRIFLLSGEELT